MIVKKLELSKELLTFVHRSLAQKSVDRVKGWTLSELLEWGISRKGGQSGLTGLGEFGFLQYSQHPEQTVWNFARRSWHNNAYWGDKGPVEFFDKNIYSVIIFGSLQNIQNYYHRISTK